MQQHREYILLHFCEEFAMICLRIVPSFRNVVFLNIWYCLWNRNIKPFPTSLLLFANGLSCYEHIFCNLSVTICDMKVAGRDVWKGNRKWKVIRKDSDHYEISHDAVNLHLSCRVGWKQWCRMRARFPVAESQRCCTLLQRVVNAAIKQIKW